MRHVISVDCIYISCPVIRKDPCCKNNAVIQNMAGTFSACKEYPMISDWIREMEAASYVQVRLEQMLNAGQVVVQLLLSSSPLFISESNT